MPLPVKAGEVFNKARFLLNDIGGAVYTDEVLLQPLQIATDNLRLECEDNNIPFTNVTSAAITVNAGVLNIGGPGGPPLPLDLVEIVNAYERIAGTNNDFQMMIRRNFLPKTEYQTTYLQVYSWQQQQVKFIGATSNIEVKIDYVGNTLNQPVDANSQILIFNSISFLYFRTAALAANFIGENKTRSDELNSEALNCIETMENIGIKQQQNNPVRRRPFMTNYRTKGWASGAGR